jgi:hypothetical protein
MDHACLVGRLQGLGHLNRDGHRLVHGHGAPPQPLLEILAINQFHDQDVVVVEVLEAEQRGDVRVVQRRQDLGLALEPGVPVVVEGEIRRQKLQGDAATESGVVGPPHLAHSALAQLPGDAVRADLGADGQRIVHGSSVLVVRFMRMRFHRLDQSW